MKSYINNSNRSIMAPNGKHVPHGGLFLADPKNPSIEIWSKAGLIDEAESGVIVPRYENLSSFSVREAKLVIAGETDTKVLSAWKSADERNTVKGLIEKRIDELK